MDRKKELKMAYKEMKIPAGVYKITNSVNGKIFVGSSMNLNGARNRLAFGVNKYKEFEKDIIKYGKDAFVFEVLEELADNEQCFDPKRELEKLEEKWLDKLQPYGEKGYNK